MFLQPGMDGLLLPFLSTRDLLRLSECSHSLLQYRNHISRLCVIRHPTPTPRMKRALLRMLTDQYNAGRGLDYLKLNHESLIPLLDLAGCFERLKTLNLSGLLPSNADGGYLVSALECGGLKDLEGLTLWTKGMTLRLVKKILNALKNGACPKLRNLELVWDKDSHEFGDRRNALGGPIAEVLRSGHCRHLQLLDLTGLHLGDEDEAETVIAALRGRSCPELVVLGLTLRSEILFQALGQALRSAACSKLEHLILPSHERGWSIPILGAIEAGGCPNFKKLRYRTPNVEPRALLHALKSGNCKRLQDIELDSWTFTGGELQELFEIVKQRR